MSAAGEPGGGPGAARADGARRSRLHLVVGAVAGLVVVLVLVLASASGLRGGRGDRASVAAGAAEAGPPRSLSPLPAPPAEPGPAAAAADPGALAAIAERLARLEAADAELARRADDIAAALALRDGAPGGGVAEAALRARETLLLGVTRRRVERGMPLGALEPLLARSFAGRDAGAVAALAAWTRAPVSRRTLERRLAELADGAGEAMAGEGRAGGLSAVFGSLARLRRPAPGMPEPARLAEAGRAVAAGEVPQAIALLDREDAPAPLRAWLSDARRLAAAEAALERLELLLIADLPEPAPPAALAPG